MLPSSCLPPATSFVRKLTWLWLAVTCLSAACGDDSPSAADASREDATASDASAADGAVVGIDGGALDGRVAPPDDARLQGDGAAIDDDADLGSGPDAAVPDSQVSLEPLVAGFQLSSSAGEAPHWVQATSSAAGSPSETLYDWGDGAGFVTASTHRYLQPGSFTVKQQVSGGGRPAQVASSLVSVSAFTPVRFSATDHGPHMLPSPDGLSVENKYDTGSIRTDDAIAPGTGVFYFEGKRLTNLSVGGFGVATAAAPLNAAPGATPDSVGYQAWGPVSAPGSVCTGAATIDPAQTELGFVIDYRGASPLVHIIQRGGDGLPAVRASCSMSVTAPVYGFYGSARSRVGYEGSINTGADTVNMPFAFTDAQLRAALTAYGDSAAAAALVPGFARTRAGRLDAAPTLQLPADLSVPLGQPVVLAGSASDVEDGDLTAAMTWVDVSSQYHARVAGSGASFTFTPTVLGRHPVDVSVSDLDGVSTTKRVMVTVTGELPRPNPVQLAPDALSGAGITVSPDGLSAQFAGPGKDGIRANQGIYGDFWYFEVHRNNPVRNMGIGLIIGDGRLNSYEPIDVPWSCSLNLGHNVWKNLFWAAAYTGAETDLDYGFAVDYRKENPTVYILVRGTIIATLLLEDVWVPIYPMLYGNIGEPPPPGFDMTANFGAAPFRIDARGILTAAGVDASALKLGWGVHAL